MGELKTLDYVPTEEIRAAMTNYETVVVHLKRQTAKGTWASIAGGHINRPIADLLHADEWIFELAGGGKYRLQATPPDEPTNVQLIPPYYVEIEGPPKTSRAVRASLQGPAVGGAGPQYPQYPQYGYPYPYPFQPPPPEDPDPMGRGLWGAPPDVIATEQTRDLRAELKREREEWAREKKDLEKKIDKLVADGAQRDREYADKLAREREQRLEAKIDALMKGPDKGAGTAEMLKAVVPVLTALITTSKDRQVLTVEQQQKAQETQTNLLLGMLKKDSGMSDILKVVVPAIGPLVIKMMDERSPSKMAELIGTMSEGHLTQFSMLSDLIRNVMPQDPDNPWMNVIQQGLDSLRTMAEQMAKVGKPAQSFTQQLGQAAAHAFETNAGTQQPAQQQQPTNGVQPDHAKQIADAICSEPQLDPKLRTQEWHAIYYAMHKMEPQAQVASMLGELLTKLEAKRELPQVFAEVFEESNRLPSDYLKEFLRPLPIMQRPDYVRVLLMEFDKMFRVSTPAEVVQ